MNQRNSSGWAPEAGEDMRAAEDAPDTTSHAEAELTIFGLVQRVVGDGRAYAETELERQKLRASILGAAGRDTAVLLLSALFLLFGALTTLLIGLVWLLAPLIGVAAALTLVLLGSFAVILILLLAAKARMRNAVRVAFDKDEVTHEQ